jgi:tRNA (guanine37-N1)-methyltransferase
MANSKTVRGYDVLGNIVVVKFDWDDKLKDKKKWAENFLKERKSVRTVLEKVGKFSGRLRAMKTKWVAGEKTKEVLYKENGCAFRFNVDTCYFSPRLASERKELAGKVKRDEEVLIMFGGVCPYGVVIGKKMKELQGKKSKGRVVSVELGRECSKYALENVKRNKLQEIVEIIQGDVRRVLPGMKGKFDRIIMGRPNLKDSFLDVAFKRIKKRGVIYYYGFYSEDDIGKLKDLILGEAKKACRKIKILRVKKAGDIGIRKFRWRVDFKVQ